MKWPSQRLDMKEEVHKKEMDRVRQQHKKPEFTTR